MGENGRIRRSEDIIEKKRLRNSNTHFPTEDSKSFFFYEEEF